MANKRKKRPAKKKRDLNHVQSLIAKYGPEPTLGELEEQLSKRRRGPRPQWTLRKRVQVYFGVEALKAAGLSPMKAQRRFAAHAKLSESVVKQRWGVAHKDFEPMFEHSGGKAEALRRHLDENPDLKALCSHIKNGNE
jgi:hypothetical protein